MNRPKWAEMLMLIGAASIVVHGILGLYIVGRIIYRTIAG